MRIHPPSYSSQRHKRGAIDLKGEKGLMVMKTNVVNDGGERKWRMEAGG